MSTTTVVNAPVVLDAEGALQARRIELQKLIETAAYYAEKWYGASYLVIDRTGHPDTADIKAVHPDKGLLDLWDLNFMLWDEAHWAATRLIPVGGIVLAQPHLHRD